MTNPMKADGELRQAIALIEQRLANCSILHLYDYMIDAAKRVALHSEQKGEA